MDALTRSRVCVLVLVLISVVAIVSAPHLHWNYCLLYNPSESAPRGWYVVVPPAHVRVNDFVLVRLPESVTMFAAQRKYLPLTVPLLKHVSALGGDKVCEMDGALSLNDHVIVHAREHDGAGRTLVPWTGCRLLLQNEFLLLSMTSDVSFDSRYFGPVQRDRIIGRAIPIWTRQ